MARLLVYTSLFKLRESAQLLIKGVLEFVIRNFVIEVDPFKLASWLESSLAIFASESVTFNLLGILMRDST